MDKNINGFHEKAEQAQVADTPVGQFMTKKVIAVHLGDSIGSVIYAFYKNQISGAPVLNDDGILQGIVTEHDLILQAATRELTAPITFTTKVTTVKVDAKLKDLIMIFYKQKIKRVPVMGAGQRVVGIVSRIDLLAQLAISDDAG